MAGRRARRRRSAAGGLAGAVSEGTRHRFVPARVWVDDEFGRPQPLSVEDDPGGWREAVYRDQPILTQFDDGQTLWPATGQACTSSASKPSHVLGMLDALDAGEGQRVLEIGTGTGYNAALLAARLGAANVTSIEIDPALAEQARAALAATGCGPVRVITGDGIGGDPTGAPFDRVIATAGIRVGQLPYSWVAQTRPGGVIVTPMRTDFSGALALVRFVVGAEGTATGRPIARVGFMAARAQRTPGWSIEGLDPHDPSAQACTTRLKPWRVAESHDARWAVGTQVPSCVWEHQPPTRPDGAHLLWLLDPAGGSWAVVGYDRATAPRRVRQHGPRRLWNEVENAFRAWACAGKPPVEASTITITPTAQTVTPAPAARSRLSRAARSGSVAVSQP